jgi:hypothetical protein
MVESTMKTWPFPVAAILLLAGVAPVAGAQDATEGMVPDPRVAAALKEAKLSYSIDGGDFRLKYDIDTSRSQIVWVASATARIDQLEIRDVWSVASRGKGSLPGELANHLLKENARMTLGAWQVNQATDEYLVVFSAQVSAAANADALQDAIEAVVFSTDRIEKELTGKDEF